MRKLATIRTIAEVKAIEGADAIEAVRVDGWWVVAKKDEFPVGTVVVYLEIDSWVPTELAPFLSKGHEPREFEGVKGERLKTVKLRGQISQGLILPLYDFAPTSPAVGAYHQTRPYVENELFDVSEILNVRKYEPQVGAQLAGNARGNFPDWLRKTDQERIQNCFRTVEKEFDGYWVGEEKLDGSSMTVGARIGDDGEAEVHVCSRNLSLKMDDANKDNSFIKAAHACNIIPALISYANYKGDIALSGELIGEGIQGNRYKIKGQEWYIFDVFFVGEGRYATIAEREAVIADLIYLGADLKEVPKLYQRTLEDMTVDRFLSLAEGKTVFGSGAEREGIVWKRTNNGDLSFKAISNKFLMKGGE